MSACISALPSLTDRMLRRRIAAFAVLVVMIRGVQAADRYVAWLVDGTKLTSRTLSAWPVPGTGYRFAGHDLLAPNNPVRLVRDRQASSSLKAPFLVLANGDV